MLLQPESLKISFDRSTAVNSLRDPQCLSQLPPATPSLQLSTARKGEPGAAKALGGCSGPDSQMGGTVPSAGQAPWSLGNQQQESGAF